MASLRDGIMLMLVARLAEEFGAATLRGGDPTAPSEAAPIVVTVFPIGESKQPVDTEFYSCVLSVGVLIEARIEDADPDEDDGNPFRYLDRLVASVEGIVHGAPWPNEEIASLEGHDVTPPSDQNVMSALVRCRFEYRHNLDDPTVYAPHYTDA